MANKKFSQFNLVTNPADVDFLAGYEGTNNVRIAPSNLPGEDNTASNVGSIGSGTAGVFKQKTGVDLEFCRLVQGTGITITQASGPGDITISASGGGGGTNSFVINSGFYHSSNTIGSRYVMPIKYVNETTSNPNYDDTYTVPYDCTLVKVFVGNNQGIPDADAITLDYALNSVLTWTSFGTVSVTNPASIGMYSEVTPSLSLSKGDRMAFGFTSTVSGSQTGRLFGVSASFVFEI